MKCWESAFNAQGSRLIIVALQVSRSSEILCSKSGGAKEKGKTGWNSVHPKKKHKNWGPPTLECWFFNFFLNLTLFMIKLRVLVLFSSLYRQFYYKYLMTRPSCKVIWISCKCMFWWFFFWCNGPSSWLIFKNIMKSPLRK
jgi:hypothetical protein